MKQSDMIDDIEQRAAAIGVPVYAICQQAGVAPTTYYRWRDGSEAKLATLNRVTDALALAELNGEPRK